MTGGLGVACTLIPARRRVVMVSGTPSWSLSSTAVAPIMWRSFSMAWKASFNCNYQEL